MTRHDQRPATPLRFDFNYESVAQLTMVLKPVFRNIRSIATRVIGMPKKAESD